MNPELYQRAQELFLRLSELSRQERATALDTACVDEPELRALVESLLEHHDAPAEMFAGGLEAPGAELLAREVCADEVSGIDTTAIPEEIGGYRVRRLLGRGGMGIVYEAEQEQPLRDVALKVIHPGVASPRLLERFRLESEVLGRLEHPGIARIYEAGTYEDASGSRPYFAMERIHGRPLETFVREGSLPLTDRLELLGKVCDAVHHAHQKGVVHRDLKPSNILIDETTQPPQPKVLDFGVARATDSDFQAVTIETDVGQLVGTLPYMSPEQAGGAREELDTRSDVYSLGVLLFEIVLGTRPYDLEGKPLHEAVRTILETDPRRPSSIDVNCRGDLDTIIAKALAKEKERRYGSAQELGDDLRRYLRHEPIAARPASTWYQLAKFTRRNRTLVVAFALTFLAMFTGTGFSLWQMGIARRESRVAEERTQAANAQTVAAHLAAATAALEAGDPIGLDEHLSRVPLSERNWPWHYLRNRIDGSLAALELEEGIAAATFATGEHAVVVTARGQVIEWRPHDDDRRSIARLEGEAVAHASFGAGHTRVYGVTGKERRTLAVWSVATGLVERSTKSLSEPVRGLALSPGERWVIAVGETSFWMWDPHSAELIERPLHSEEGAPRGNTPPVIGFVPGDRHFGIGRGRGLDIYDYVGRRLLAFQTDAEEVRSVAFDSRGERMAVGDRARRLLIDRVEADARWPVSHRRKFRTHVARGHRGAVTAVAFRRDGSEIVSAGGRTVQLREAASGRVRRVFAGHERDLDRVEVSDDGTRVLGYSRAGSARVWSVTHPRGGDRLSTEEGCRAFRISEDDYVLVVNGLGELELWDLVAGARVFRANLSIEGETSPITAVATTGRIADALSDEGARIVTGHENGVLALRDLRSGRVVTQVDGHRGAVHDVAFVGDTGARVVSVAADGTVALWGAAALEPIATRVGRASVPTGRIAVASSGELAVALGNEVALLDARDLGVRSVSPLLHPGEVRDVVFDPDGAWFASAASDRTIRIWRARDGEPLGNPIATGEPVRCLTVHPEGGLLASGHDDATVALWRVETRSELLRFGGLSDPPRQLAYSPDGARLIAGGAGPLRTWDVAPDRVRRQHAAAREARRARLRPRISTFPEDLPALRNAVGVLQAEADRRVARELLLARGFGVTETTFFYDFERVERDTVHDRIGYDGVQRARLRGRVRVAPGARGSRSARFPAPVGGASARTASVEIPGTDRLGREWTLSCRVLLRGEARRDRVRLLSSYDGVGPVREGSIVLDIDLTAEKYRGVRLVIGQEWTSCAAMPTELLEPGYHTVTLTFDHGQVELFIDGVRYDLDNPRFKTEEIVSHANLRFGEDADPEGVGGVNEQFVGDVDFILVAGWVLDAAAIGALARNEGWPIAPHPERRAVLYDFDAGAVRDLWRDDGAQDGVVHTEVSFVDGAARFSRRRWKPVAANAIDVGVVGSLGREFTIALWVTLAADERRVVLSSCRGGKSHGLRLSIGAAGGIRFLLPGRVRVESDASLEIGVPHHVAATYDPTGVRLYLDGVEVASWARSGIDRDVDLGDRALRIGADHDPSASETHFVGEVDELLLLRRALTREQVRQLSEGETPAGLLDR